MLTFILGPIWLAILELVAIIGVAVFLVIYYDLMSARKQKLITHISSDLEQYIRNISDDFPLPIIICAPDGKIEWFNNRFEEAIGPHSSGYSELSSVFENVGIDTLLDASVNGVVIDCVPVSTGSAWNLCMIFPKSSAPAIQSPSWEYCSRKYHCKYR